MWQPYGSPTTDPNVRHGRAELLQDLILYYSCKIVRQEQIGVDGRWVRTKCGVMLVDPAMKKHQTTFC